MKSNTALNGRRINQSSCEHVASCSLNKSYSTLIVNFTSCFIVHSLGTGLFLSIDGLVSFSLWMRQFSQIVAAQPCTNEVEVASPL